jgi:hypothetical protein
MFLLNMSWMQAMEIVTAQSQKELKVQSFKAIKKKNKQIKDELYKEEGLCQRIGLFLYTSSSLIAVAGALAYNSFVVDMPIDNVHNQYGMWKCSDCLTIV